MTVQLLVEEASQDPRARAQIRQAVDEMPFHIRVIAALSAGQFVATGDAEDGSFVVGVGVNRNAPPPRRRPRR